MALSWVLMVLAANPFLDQAQKLYRELEFEQAEALLKVLKSQPLPPDERRKAHDLLARVLFAKGQKKEAEEIYRELLEKDPMCPDLDAAPEVRALFDHAKKALFKADYVRLSAPVRDEKTLQVELLDPWRQVTQVTAEVDGAPPVTLEGNAAALDATGAVQVRALNARGRVLATVALESLKAPAPAPAAAVRAGPEVTADVRPPRRVLPWALGIGGAAALAAGGAMRLAVLSETNAQSSATFSADRELHHTAAVGWHAASWVCFGLAAACLTWLVVWLVTS